MNKITDKLPYMPILTYYLNKKLEIIKVERVILPKERGGGACSGRSRVTCKYDWEEQNSRASTQGTQDSSVDEMRIWPYQNIGVSV